MINFHYFYIQHTVYRHMSSYLVLFEVSTYSPSLIIGQCVPVFLEQGIDPRDATVPRVLQVLQSQPPVLGIGFLPLQPVLCPHPLAVNELTLPWLNVAAENRLVSLPAQHPTHNTCTDR